MLTVKTYSYLRQFVGGQIILFKARILRIPSIKFELLFTYCPSIVDGYIETCALLGAELVIFVIKMLVFFKDSVYDY